jgi:NAD+ dependent glucose-6-phosphate dehydrogenase
MDPERIGSLLVGHRAMTQDDPVRFGVSGPLRVLITGATGNIGAKLRAYLGAQGRYELTLLCLNPKNDPDVVTADLSIFDESWGRLFEGIDVVLHVAADPSPFSSWGSIQRANLDLLFNVMAAAQKCGVRRFVFASSNFVVAGYRFARDPLTTCIEPKPINAYGASKLVGERLGKMFADQFDLPFIAFRIGVCQRNNENRHGPWIPFGHWGQSMWVSDRDLCRAFECAIVNRSVRFGVYNLVSRNPGMRWEIESLKRDLDFTPQDGESMRSAAADRLRASFAWLRDFGLPAIGAKLAGKRW